jgi:hypothetical protein
LPSSLTRVRSSALVSSTSLPVSVCGTGSQPLPTEPFVPVQVLAPCGLPCGSHSYSLLSPCGPTSLNDPRLVAPHPPQGLRASARLTGAGITTGSPSPTPCGLGLGPTHPLRSVRAVEPSGFRRWGFAPHYALLIPTFALVSRPRPLPPPLPPPDDAPLPPGRADLVPRFGGVFGPAELSARCSSTSELLRTLSRMAASKPTSWLSGQRHFLAHATHTWGP